MQKIRNVCSEKSSSESIIYLRKVGQCLEKLEKLLDDNVDITSTIWATSPKEHSKQQLVTQQLYVAYKLETFHQLDINITCTVFDTVISLIREEQVKILQTAPSAFTKPLFQRSESSNDDVTNKKSKWW
jgi:hypothetical protein